MSVGPDRSRFDWSHTGQLLSEDTLRYEPRWFLASPPAVGCLTDEDDSEPELLTEGTQIVSASVAQDAPAPVEVTAACRDEVYTVDAGEEFERLQQEDAEPCTVQFRSVYAELAETEPQS